MWIVVPFVGSVQCAGSLSYTVISQLNITLLGLACLSSRFSRTYVGNIQCAGHLSSTVNSNMSVALLGLLLGIPVVLTPITVTVTAGSLSNTVKFSEFLIPDLLFTGPFSTSSLCHTRHWHKYIASHNMISGLVLLSHE